MLGDGSGGVDACVGFVSCLFVVVFLFFSNDLFHWIFKQNKKNVCFADLIFSLKLNIFF